MKIGILGSGGVGQTLAVGLKDLGHEVQIGSREGNKLAEFTAKTGIAEGRFAEVAQNAEVVLLAVQGAVAEGLVAGLVDVLGTKVVLDLTNPIAGGPVNGVLPYFTAANESLLERLQAAAPQVRFVKWFNSVGAPLMVRPRLNGTPTMFLCGNDRDAKRVGADLARELGWNAEDRGGANLGHALEALCQLWCAAGFVNNDWAHAFAVVRPA